MQRLCTVLLVLVLQDFSTLSSSKLKSQVLCQDGIHEYGSQPWGLNHVLSRYLCTVSWYLSPCTVSANAPFSTYVTCVCLEHYQGASIPWYGRDANRAWPGYTKSTGEWFKYLLFCCIKSTCDHNFSDDVYLNGSFIRSLQMCKVLQHLTC